MPALPELALESAPIAPAKHAHQVAVHPAADEGYSLLLNEFDEDSTQPILVFDDPSLARVEVKDPAPGAGSPAPYSASTAKTLGKAELFRKRWVKAHFSQDQNLDPRLRTSMDWAQDGTGRSWYFADAKNDVIWKVQVPRTPGADEQESKEETGLQVEILVGTFPEESKEAKETKDSEGPGERSPLAAPSALVWDGLRRCLWVSDQGSGRILKVDPATKTVTPLHLEGEALGAPMGIDLDPGGKFLVVADAEANKILRIVLDERGETGHLATMAGSGVAGQRSGPALDARFNVPSDVAIGSSGEVFVADFGGKTLRMITAEQDPKVLVVAVPEQDLHRFQNKPNKPVAVHGQGIRQIGLMSSKVKPGEFHIVYLAEHEPRSIHVKTAPGGEIVIKEGVAGEQGIASLLQAGWNWTSKPKEAGPAGASSEGPGSPEPTGSASVPPPDPGGFGSLWGWAHHDGLDQTTSL